MTEAAAGVRLAEERRGVLLVLLSAAAYGALPVMARFAFAEGLTLAGILAWRFLLAVLGFALLAPRPAPRLPLRTRLALWGAGLVFILNTIVYFVALTRVPVSLLSLILYTYPVIVTLLSAALGVETLRTRNLLAGALSVLGAATTVGSFAGADRLGLLLAFASALIYSTYIVVGTRLARGLPAQAAAAHIAQVSLAVYLPWALLRGELALPPTALAWAALLGLGTLSTVVALRSFLAGLQRVGPSRAAVLSCFEIVVTLTLATLFLGESPTPRLGLGAALIIGAVLLQHLGRR